ncbi:hypothetical protein GOP47_0010288 [Adiantum capillus-veneris]|uniref:UspA domain-containing protein n=1 Tax=Adiantum capillus-veneris TaxID=13818 RepID=A0A9D4UUZ6_ADICA|nr:hypothetical protein GOP47_0010288 [Adiantum capillus-veneris]
MEHQEQKLKGRTFLVAVDEGEHSLYALQWALDTLYIGTAPDDHIVVLYVKPSHATLSGPAFVLTSEAVDSLERYDNLVVSKILSTVYQICGERKVRFEVKVLTGDPRDIITETAHALKATFLVMGSHGFGAIKRALLGSVSDYCSHHVHCPVVIVKKPEGVSEI